MVKRAKRDLKSLASQGESGFESRRRQCLRDDDDRTSQCVAFGNVPTASKAVQPPAQPPSSFGDWTAEAFGVSAVELVAIVRRMVRLASGGVTHDLEDATQEALCRMLEVDAYRFDSTRALTGFVACRARWTLRDMRRKESRRGRLDAADLSRSSAPTEHPAPDVADAMPDLTHLLASLSADERAVLQAHDVEGTSLRSLARQWGVGVATLSRRRAKALSRLRLGLG